MSERQNTATTSATTASTTEDQLQPEDTLVDDDVDDVLNRATPRSSGSRGSLAHGVTAEEQHHDETIEERIHQEVPDPTSAYGAPDNESGFDDGDDRLAATRPTASRPRTTGSATARSVTRVRVDYVAPDEGVGSDDEKDLVGEDVGVEAAGGLGRGGRDAHDRAARRQRLRRGPRRGPDAR